MYSQFVNKITKGRELNQEEIQEWTYGKDKNYVELQTQNEIINSAKRT